MMGPGDRGYNGTTNLEQGSLLRYYVEACSDAGTVNVTDGVAVVCLLEFPKSPLNRGPLAQVGLSAT